MTQEDFSAVCPYLGLADDADSHATYATEAHRCYRLPNPTRIAPPHQESYCLGANHVTCPVYLGEGVPKGPTAAGAAGAAAAGAAGAAAAGAIPAAEQGGTVPGPRPGQRPAGRRPFETQAGRTGARRQSTEPLGPRPRSGGISMPVATIGLFALALVVIGLAFAINNIVGGGDDDDKLSPADVTGTQAAQRATQTAAGGGAQRTQTPGTQPAVQTAGQTPGQTRPPGTGTPSGGQTPGAGAATYTVKAGDLCGTIASNNGITLQQLLTANNMSEDDCTRLQVGQTLKLR